jgi:hypothetical protein
MPFTDDEIKDEMERLLVVSGVMTKDEQAKLLKDPTELKVKGALAKEKLNKFADYWKALGVWMASKDGNLKNTTGTNVPGRDGGNPVGIGIVLYNDAFHDVNKYIDSKDFSSVKAVSNHLRFVKNIIPSNDDDSDS